ncbi:hypothetical protein [Azorhizophilus paspali]|uniref:Uncharacterized protein n=1 Tax=Azorhizophilus paspali TaxID=69963 RepID=A0ABV6SGF0_AZOPA
MKNIDEETTLNFEGVDKSIMLRRDDFIRMALPTDSGSIDMKNFGCWLRIGSDGLYVNIDHEDEVDLTPEEAATLCSHPTGKLDEPALPFPFSIAQLERFLDFANEEGRDVPLNCKKFEEIIALKSLKRKSTQASVLRQQEQATPKAREINPDNADSMPKEAQAVEQPPQKCAPQETAGAQVFEPTQQESITQRPAEPKKKSALDQRIEHIYQWFEEQSEFTATNLRVNQTGNSGARDTCWLWLEAKGLTRPGYIFSGALQAGSLKTKSFVNAWSEFLKHIKKNQT